MSSTEWPSLSADATHTYYMILPWFTREMIHFYEAPTFSIYLLDIYSLADHY
jgi:hypothetical protein